MDGNAVNDGDVFTYSVGTFPCIRTAEVTINLLPAPNPGTDNAITVCEGDASFDMLAEIGGDAGGTWTGPSVIAGNTYNPATNDPGTYTYTIDPANCPAESADLTVNEVPDADAGNSNTTTVCESVGNIDLTTLLGGSPDASGTWSDAGGTIGNPYNVSGQCGTTLNLTYTVDNGTCSDVTNLTLTVECIPDAGPDDILSFCGDGSTINLDDELPPGISGGSWSPTGNITLDAANAGNYTYEITPDACNPDDAIYTINIDEPLDISNLDTQCQPNQTEYTIEFDISGGDGNYTFTSTPGAPDITGNIVGGTFTSDPIDVASVPTATVTISDGGPCDDVDVNVNAPNCSCPATAAFANGNQTICLGESADLILDLDGTGPYTVGYDDGTGTIFEPNLNDGDAIPVSPAVTTTYTLESVEDANCVGSATGTITITVDEPTDAGPDDVVDLCGDGSNLNLDDLLPAGTNPGSWAPSGNITLNSGNAGNYTYTTDANACPSDDASYTLNIFDELSTSGLTVSCEANQTEYTIEFDISGGDGNYTFTSTPGAPDITGNIVGGTFTSDPIDVASVPNATITISDGGPCGNVDVNVNAPNCSCPVSGTFDTGNGLICLGESYDIVLDLTGGTDGDYNIEYSDGTNTFTPSGLSDQDVITVTPTTTTTYSFSSVSDSNCPGSANGSVTVTVEDPPNAGDDIVLDFCGDGSNLNLLSLLDGSADGDGSFNQANISLLPENAGIYTYTEPGNACADDDADYTISIIEELNYTDVSAVCESNQTEYTVTFTITGGTPPYFVDGNAIGTDEFSETVDFDANPTYEYDISDSGICDDVTVSGTAPDCNCIAEGSISASTTICEGDCATITFDLIGDGPFNVVYENLNNGATEPLFDISDGHTISVCPAAETTYTLVSVEDSYCEGVVSGNDVVVSVDTSVEVSDITETCDDINENYVVEFTVTGGDGTYNILPQFPVNGSFDDATGIYTTNPIPSGNGYTITVNDGGECPSVIVENESFDCGCISDAGSLNQTPLGVCDGESLTVDHLGDETLDGNDGFQFVLHDGDANNIGSVIATSTDGSFVFNYGAIVPGQVYYIAAVAGNTNGLGNVDLNHPCTNASAGVEVVVNPLPTASISGSSVVCEGEPVSLVVSFTGEGNWDFTFAVNNDEDPDTITSTSSEYILTVTQPGTYTLTSVSDNNCLGTTSGAVSVQNYDQPTATISGESDVCEGSGDGPTVELTGDGPWNFVYTIDGEEQPPVTTNFPSNTLPVEESGNYTLVSVNDENCDGVVSGNVNVNLIAQPSATITGGGTICEGEEAEFNVELTGSAPWTINYQIDGFNQTPLQTSDPNFSFMDGTGGNYVITTVQDANCVGVVNTQASLTVNPTPTATYSSDATSFCDGEEIDLALNLEGVPPFHVTYVLNGDTITATGVQGGIFQTLTPQSTVTAEVISIEDGSNPTCSSEPNASIVIPQVQLPNAPVLASDTICATQDSLAIGVSPSPGLSYSWSPESNLSDPTVSNPIFSAEVFGVQPRTFTYMLTASNGDCEATDTMTVTVDPGPTARFVQTPAEINIDDPLVRFKNTSIARQGTFFFWEFDTLDTSEEYEPNFTFPQGIEGNYTVMLTAIDPLTGCLDMYTDIITVEPKMLIYVPNAFTPDGDGLNDLWGPVLTNIDEDDYRLTVFDRLGEIVFETRDPDKKWNGSMNGDGYYLKSDVYVWVIETKEIDGLEEITRRGRVTLVR
ncbi:MAG: gliding motility-associated C-terminal domain-containing protein [Flavobacteriales bacterium]|nr:gliding motility-associated C-terminal domain-containing protein [Flavobacteriales bacterium]